MKEKKEQGSKKIKIYADRLDKELRMRKWTILGHVVLYVFLVSVIIFLVLKGNVVVVGENLVASGSAGYSFSDPDVMRIRADGHTRLFYSRFFTFDYNNFEKQKNKAIYLGSGSVEEVYTKLKKAGFYEEVLNNHYLVKATPDSLKIIPKGGGTVEVISFGKMVLTNNVYLESRRLDLKLFLSPVAPVKELNPFGFSIEKMVLVSNEVLREGTLGDMGEASY